MMASSPATAPIPPSPAPMALPLSTSAPSSPHVGLGATAAARRRPGGFLASLPRPGGSSSSSSSSASNLSPPASPPGSPGLAASATSLSASASSSSNPAPVSRRFAFSNLLKRRASTATGRPATAGQLPSGPVSASMPQLDGPPPVPALPEHYAVDAPAAAFASGTMPTDDSVLSSRRRTVSFHGMYAARAVAAASGSQLGTGDAETGDVYSNHVEDYVLGETIGIGASAHVVAATYLPTQRQLAVKVVDLDRFERCQIEELRKEIQVMSLCRHPHLLPIYRSFVTDNHLHIVTPLRTAGAVNHLLKTQFPHGLPEPAIAAILAQILQGIHYLHRNNLIHRDIKGGNVLLDRETGLAQLGDFGVSSSLCEGVHRTSRKSFVGSLLWMAPEIMQQTSSYDHKADLWSLGITCLEMAQGLAPYAEYPPLKVCLLVLNNNPPTLDRSASHYKYSRAFKDLIDACLMRNPALRPDAAKLLQLPFVKKAKKPLSLVKTLDLASLPPLTATSRTPVADLLATETSWDFSLTKSGSTDLHPHYHHHYDQAQDDEGAVDADPLFLPAPDPLHRVSWAADNGAAGGDSGVGSGSSSDEGSPAGTETRRIPEAAALPPMPPMPPSPTPALRAAPGGAAAGAARSRANSVMEIFST
ncbi:hypothetical protein H9P43_000074 [Blastocladiella emersonii ATCC 22665]|nr:hypothetical protein H9P43_000074 [Blastocladiella emersonii ATCC 22665]